MMMPKKEVLSYVVKNDVKYIRLAIVKYELRQTKKQLTPHINGS